MRIYLKAKKLVKLNELKEEMENSQSSADSMNDLNGLSADFTKYINISTDKERQAFDQSIDDLLTTLDEYTAAVDLVRSDTNLCLNSTIPSIYEKSLQLQNVFNKIDQLERFVAVVKSDVTQMEALLDQAESELATKSPVAKLFSAIPKPSFFSKKRNTPTFAPVAHFSPPALYKTGDYLDYSKNKADNLAKSDKNETVPEVTTPPAQAEIETSNENSSNEPKTDTMESVNSDKNKETEGQSEVQVSQGQSESESDAKKQDDASKQPDEQQDDN